MDEATKIGLAAIVDGQRIRYEEPMHLHTTFRVGGPADVYVTPAASELAPLLRFLKESNEKYTVIGNGSNLLVADKGISGIVIQLGEPMTEIRMEENEAEGCRIYALAGTKLSAVARAAADEGLTGMEFASGIPGSIGGAVVMNAGAYGGEMKDIIDAVTAIQTDGTMRVYRNEELSLSYRHSIFHDNEEVVMAVTLKLNRGKKEDIEEKMRTLREQRKTKQPIEFPSAGSTFKRPEGYFAGKLIEDAGLRGFRIGGACVSPKHCGFVVNDQNASAKDVYEVIRHVQEEVKRQFGVSMETEVRLLGDFDE